MRPPTNRNKRPSTGVGWTFAPAAAAALGFESGAVFAVNQFHPRSPTAVATAVLFAVIGLLLLFLSRRRSGWLSDIALGAGGGGLVATITVGLATAGGAG